MNGAINGELNIIGGDNSGLNNSRAVIRFADRGDYAAMLEIYSPYVQNTKISFEYVAPTLQEFSARMDALSGAHPVIVCEDGGEVVGYAYSSPAFERRAYAWCADISVYVRDGMLGKGIGSALTCALCDLLKEAGYRKVYALITEGNVRSISMHRKCGFKEVAFFPEQGYKHGEWIGVCWLERTLNGKSVCQSFPKAVSELSEQTCGNIFALCRQRLGGSK
ncbi:MAG: GNAT family N-acetyltransferase [Candidatus Coproplasma sp.]